MVEPGFELWRCCQRALSIFLQCASQWRTVASMSGVFRQGLDYTALESVMRLNGVKPHKVAQLFADVRLIEQGALQQLAADRDRAAS